MLSFIFAIVFLIIGYAFYGKVVDKNFAPDDRLTPAMEINDKVDFIPMPTWKVFLIQLLNIAGTGPIFGALCGALFGPVVYIWIVLGSIFAGGVHDYFTGMISCRLKGVSISEIAGEYLGGFMKNMMVIFSIILLVMCGVVFTTGPADLLNILTNNIFGYHFWLIAIIFYYFVATFLPIDKVIGKLYPVFGICLILMGVGVALNIIIKPEFVMLEVWDNFENLHPENTPIWPFMFVTVACGAISGFHATQSPMMARCIKSERDGRKVFYGAMIAEGVIALVWAFAGVSCYKSTNELLLAGGGCSAVVYEICKNTMGKFGSVLALIGVIICPISSGDTAYRSARLTLADKFRIDQAHLNHRVFLSVPLLVVGSYICHLNYQTVWRYFSWSNQTLAMIALWAISVYLKKEKKNYLISLIPAVFMSMVSLTYFVVAPECLGVLWNVIGIDFTIYYKFSIVIGVLFTFVLVYIFEKSTNS